MSISSEVISSLKIGQSAGGGTPTLSTLDDIIKSFATSGLLSDFRMSDALYTSSADTSTPVTTDGDLVGRVLNQSTASASTGWFLNEAASKSQWVENYGLASATVFGNSAINDTVQSTGWTILDGMTVVLPIRIPQSARDTYTASPFLVKDALNKFNISGRLKGDGNLYCRSAIGTGVDHQITPDANDVAVVIMQTTSDGQPDGSATVDIYCNNTFVVQRSAAGQLSSAFSFTITDIRSDPIAGMQIMGLGIAKGSMSSAQRQSFCDYFQANGGVLA